MPVRHFPSSVFTQLLVRAVRTDYLENITGFAWLIVQPLLLLAIYAFVFTTIFKARIPDAGDIGFVPWLAIAFWPWTAFSEAVLRASGSITANAALIGKVAFPSELLPLSTVTATFSMHMVGYLAVLAVLQLMGIDIRWLGVLVAIPLLLGLFLFACALALMTSALQVFIRDVAQILPPLMTFWFFATPILYSPAVLPPGLAGLMKLNPMTWYMERLRGWLLVGPQPFGWPDLVVPLFTLALFGLALLFYRRLQAHFQDFL